MTAMMINLSQRELIAQRQVNRSAILEEVLSVGRGCIYTGEYVLLYLCARLSLKPDQA